jgi:hypothetical protein
MQWRLSEPIGCIQQNWSWCIKKLQSKGIQLEQNGKMQASGRFAAAPVQIMIVKPFSDRVIAYERGMDIPGGFADELCNVLPIDYFFPDKSYQLLCASDRALVAEKRLDWSSQLRLIFPLASRSVVLMQIFDCVNPEWRPADDFPDICHAVTWAVGKSRPSQVLDTELRKSLMCVRECGIVLQIQLEPWVDKMNEVVGVNLDEALCNQQQILRILQSRVAEFPSTGSKGEEMQQLVDSQFAVRIARECYYVAGILNSSSITRSMCVLK